MLSAPLRRVFVRRFAQATAPAVDPAAAAQPPPQKDHAPHPTEQHRPPAHAQHVVPPGVTVVSDRGSAAAVVSHLLSLPRDRAVAWDTETTGVNPAKQSPVHRGSVICATAYAGPDVDFGAGPRLFVDTLDGEPGLLDVFRPYFEDDGCAKVWHHYAFDRHVLANDGVRTAGFAADTMHMARLHNSALQRYALSELCITYLDEAEKITMQQRFGRRELKKDGTPCKAVVIPPTVELQRGADTRHDWIEYSTMDAELTHRLYCVLRNLLARSRVAGSNGLPALARRYPTLLALYDDVLRPFGQLLTDVERTGFRVDVDLLRDMQTRADADRACLERKFLAWAATRSPDAAYMNINSDQQKLQLLFAPCVNKKKDGKAEPLPASKSFTIAMEGAQKERFLADLAARDTPDDHARLQKYRDAEKPDKPLKVDISLRGLKKKSSETTEGGWPSVSAKALRKLAGWPRADPPRLGDPGDPDMCLAVDDMMEANTISTLSSTFIVPLQNWAGRNNRIHASLNLNTETGRLSSRRPNLQNQPALEKDRYKIRKAFVCEPGNRLIVADYGQLELRLLAHITGCRSMIDAFRAGGDFHSRTALTMFEHVKQAVDRGDCLLEKDTGKGDVPLLKDMFSSERRKAKTLNFSIAYGKTVKGLARDWNVDDAEARETLRLWYKERQEVSRWQFNCKKLLREKGYVETILGRRRHFVLDEHDMRKRAHAERAAINAPLQGSAADLVMAAMVKLHHNPVLQVLGWKIILQVHDEIILEGPEESAEVALPIVVEEMENPIDVDLNVDLTVDARCAKSWYDAK